MKNNHKITLLIKPTHACNFNCIYCYNNLNNNSVSKNIISDEVLFKTFDILSKQYNRIDCIWLGGEPLIYGKENFIKVFNYQKNLEKRLNIIFTNAIQTNTMLIDNEFEKILKTNCVSVGMSYDGIKSIFTRKHGEELWNKILELKDNNLSNSILYVLSGYNKNVLVDDYKSFRDNNLNVQINRYIPVGNNDKYLNISNEEYCNIMFELFKIYYEDLKNGLKLIIQPFYEYMNIIIKGVASSCHFGSCLYKYMCVDPNGDIYLCARHTQKICNINDVSNYSDIIYCDTYRKIHQEKLHKREKCKDCNFFYYCGGGCHFRSMLNDDYCDEFKNLFSKIKNCLENVE